MRNRDIIFTLQLASMIFMWVFVFAIAIWIFNLIQVAYKHSDSFDASLAISIVAVPIFFILATILTYVFFGLRKGRKPEDAYSEYRHTEVN
jgi:hypothetical protein